MKKKIVIVVSGYPGVGKTTHAKRIAEKFGLKYVSNGSIFRKIAESLNISLEEMHRLAENDPKYDLMVDEESKKIALKGNVVIDGHLAAWVLKNIADIKILLKAPLEVRARRIAERDNISFDAALKDAKFREESNRKRCKDIYGLDMDDWSFFDIIIDTSNLPIEGVSETLYIYIKNFIDFTRDEFSN